MVVMVQHYIDTKEQDFNESIEMKKQAANGYIHIYKRRYGETFLDLAAHAAFPLCVNQDIANFLCLKFCPNLMSDCRDVDILKVPLFREIGDGLYEVESETKNLLLLYLVNKFGKNRIYEIVDLVCENIENKILWESFPIWEDSKLLKYSQKIIILDILDHDKAVELLNEFSSCFSYNSENVLWKCWISTIRKEIARNKMILKSC